MKRFRLLKSVFALAGVLFMLTPAAVFASGNDYTIDCGDEEPIINLQCQREKIFDPGSECQLLYCSGDDIPDDVETLQNIVDLNLFNLFQVRIRVNSSQAFAGILYVGFSMFLGVVALAVVLLGVYGAFKRSRTTSEDDIAASQKIITNAIIGFVLIGMSLLIVQFVASFLGLGSINDLVDITPLFENTFIG